MDLKLNNGQAKALLELLNRQSTATGALPLDLRHLEEVRGDLNKSLEPKPYTLICRDGENGSSYPDPLIYHVEFAGEPSMQDFINLAWRERRNDLEGDGDEEDIDRWLTDFKFVFAFAGHHDAIHDNRF